jgi:hypothetical protein
MVLRHLGAGEEQHLIGLVLAAVPFLDLPVR